MLYQQENVQIDMLDEYLETSNMNQLQSELSQEQMLINDIFSDFS